MIYDVAVIGGGPAGLAAAIEAHKKGAKVILIEREARLGGILKQCIHDGFGLVRFGKKLSGPEYAEIFIDEFRKENIEALTLTFVTKIQKTDGGFDISVVNRSGAQTLRSKTLILATGCRERTAKQVSIHGTRPSGVFTAGTAQHFTNLLGELPVKKCVILGSGDIGLIMARRLTLEGAKVLGVYEAKPTPSGLTRNIHQCLHDYGIPLYLSHTVTDVISKNGRVAGVTVQKVDEKRRPIPGTEMHFDCDTLLLSVGLIPENELTRSAGIEIDPRTGGAIVYENMETSASGIFACGNVVHVHDLVDYVSMESERAGLAAAEYLKNGKSDCSSLTINNGTSITYTVPQKIKDLSKPVSVFFRVNRIFEKSAVRVSAGDETLISYPRSHMAPGEMEKITLTPAMLEKAKGHAITISCEEA